MATGGKIVRVVIKGEDQLSRVLKQMQSQLNRLERSVNSTNSRVERMASTATRQYSRVSTNISTATSQQHNLNNAVARGLSPVKQLTDAVKTLIATYLGINAVESLIKTSDAITLTTARLDLFNDGLQTTAELTDKIYESAQRSRGSYLDMADLVSKYSAVALDKFGSTDNVVAFTEVLQKMFTVSGASGQEIYSASLQLKQALGTGRLMGEEFRAVMEAAPLFGQAIAEYMTSMNNPNWGKNGVVGIGDLKELASDSQITSDIMVGAMFSAADDINAKFNEMPYTFNQVWTMLKNTVVKSLDDVWKKLTAMISNGELDQFLATLGNAIVVVATAMVWLFDIALSIFNVISDNWSLIAPIIYTIVGAIVAYNAALLIHNTIQGISTAIKTISTIRAIAHGAAITGEMIATTGMTAAQLGFNAALYACPLVWILAIIMIVIAAIYMLVAAVNKFTDSSVSATGILLGVLTTAIGAVWNLMVGLWNTIITIVAHIWDRIAMFANFFANVFTDPVGAFKNLFIDAIVTVLDGIKVLAEALDSVTFGALDASGTVSGWQDGLKSKKVEQKVVMADSSTWADNVKLDYMDVKSAWNMGYEIGEGIDNKVGGLFDGIEDITSGGGAGYDWDKLAGQFGAGSNGADGVLGDIAGNVSNIADGVSVSNEDLKYLRQLAEQRAINRFTTAEIKIDMNNTNNIGGTQDIDGIVKSLEEKLYESMSIAAEGVHV